MGFDGLTTSFDLECDYMIYDVSYVQDVLKGPSGMYNRPSVKPKLRSRRNPRYGFNKSRKTVLKAMDEMSAQSPENQIRWLLTFLEKDLSKLSVKEKILDSFLLRTLGKEVPPFSWAERGEPMSTERLANLQGQIATGMRQLLSPSGQWMLPDMHVSSTIRRVQLDKTVWRVWSDEQATEPEDILHSIARLLERCGDRLRTCARCQSAFLTEDLRQIYCSQACAQAVAHERYRRVHRDKLRTRRREAYRQKKQAELGSNVKIAQRRMGGE